MLNRKCRAPLFTVIVFNRAADIREYQFKNINTINSVQQSIAVLLDMAYRGAFLTLANISAHAKPLCA